MADTELLRAFRNYQRARNLALTTITAYGRMHRQYAAFLEARGSELLRATRDDVAAFLGSRNAKAPRTKYSYCSRIAAFYRWAISEGLTDHDPTGRVTRPLLPEGVPRVIGTDDLLRAVEAAVPRTRCFLLLAAFAGLRCKEIAGVRREDLLLHQDPPVLIVSSPKGRRERVVPLHPDVIAALRAFGLPARGYVFPWWDDPDRAIRPHTVSHLGNAHLHGLDIDETMHTIRAWFLTSIHNRTKDMRLTAQLAGHRSMDTTACYVAVNALDAVAAVIGLALQ